ncbi:hypothetical protein E1B28_008647 [Marasmius oreades]|uniref:Uncharacterized protein n=1 Tax=Marasmius oreades TaxID=181124 RepID=A0A9P7USL2_9AGAR|nr:uncharacterized protein E1B28_008647 [Marasmius oreades]KAG7092285.1 hypothetical protein E1B28_008647 [Marasmius oreades]
MVHLLLVSTKGNGVRYFPFAGYLGLTPVKVEGVVCTKLDSDLKTLPAKSITISVRCYESRLGRLGALQTNVIVDHSQILWTKPEGQEYDAIGDGEYPFRIALPPRVAGFSTVSFPEYRCVWRVEAVINHIPLTGIGSRQVKHVDLPLMRYDLPPSVSRHAPSHHDCEPKLDRHICKQPRGPRISYSMATPKAPIGPTDLVSIPIHILPDDSGVSIRSAILVVERRIFLNDSASARPLTSSTTSLSSQNAPTSQSAPASSSLPIPSRFSSSTSSLALSLLSGSYGNEDNNSLTALTRNSPSRSSDSLSTRAIITPVAGSESSGPFSRSPSGLWSKALTFQWPTVKSTGRWAIGETIQSELVAVKFYLRVKVIVTSSYGTDSLDLDEEELFVVSINDSERRIAMAKYQDLASSSDSKSKSLRHSRREAENVPELPIPSAAECPPHPSASSFSKSMKSKTPRRPHTSAGPRDKSFGVTGSRVDSRYDRTFDTYHRDHDDQTPYRRKLRPGTATTPEVTRSSASGFVYSTTRVSTGPSIRSNSTYASDSTTASKTSVSGGLSLNIRDSANIREWEEELAQIEAQSRRSSDLLGFGLRRKRPSTATSRTPLLFAGKA